MNTFIRRSSAVWFVSLYHSSSGMTREDEKWDTDVMKAKFFDIKQELPLSSQSHSLSKLSSTEYLIWEDSANELPSQGLPQYGLFHFIILQAE